MESSLAQDLGHPQRTAGAVGEAMGAGDSFVLAETHISWVFARGDDVFKVKKPVSLGFLDFSTPEKRRVACLAEVELNRRLAPEVYCGVVPITRDASGRHQLGGAGEPVDWAVQMKKLDDRIRGDALLARSELTAQQLEQLAVKLADFHAAVRCDGETALHGTPAAIAHNVQENFVQTQATIHEYLAPEEVAEITRWQTGFLTQEAARFKARSEGQRVRDGHGDLRLEHIYWQDDHVLIIDCIEFNDRFRFADVCADIAFLAMDLTWHDRPDLAERFLAAYARAANDYDLYPLVDFYESYRAFVRGKVAAFLAHDLAAPLQVRARAQKETRRFFLLALASGRRALAPPQVVAVGGLIAAGKSTVAEALGAALQAPVLSADLTRKFLLGVAPQTKVHVQPFAGAYSEAMTERVYAEVLRRAGAVLLSGRSVILDASFRTQAQRAQARQLAQDHGIPFLFVECRAPHELCRERLRQRAQQAGVSDGRLEIFADFVARFEPVSELAAPEHQVLDTRQPLAVHLEALRARLGVEA